jgi:hypothetical protein
MRDSRFGRALVVECRPGAGGYLLGFKIDDAAARERTQTEVLTLHSAWYERPDFGIKFDVETDGGEDSGAGTGAAGPAPKARVMDDVQIVEDGEEEGKYGWGGGGGRRTRRGGRLLCRGRGGGRGRAGSGLLAAARARSGGTTRRAVA